MRVYDVNLGPGLWTPALVAELARCADVLKVSEQELFTLHRLGPAVERSVATVEAAMRALADRSGVRVVACSRGANGGSLLLDGAYVQAPAPRVTVADAVGAGDAFTAAVIHGLHLGHPPDRLLAEATALGSLIASRTGALPPWQPSEWPTHAEGEGRHLRQSV